MNNLSRKKFLGIIPMSAAGLLIGSKTNCSPKPFDKFSREDLKITDIRVTLLSCKIPPDKYWMTRDVICTKTDSILVQIYTDKGIIGIGGASQYGKPEFVKKHIEGDLKPLLIGKNPFDISYLTPHWGNSGFGHKVAWAGIDVALWDIIGKAKSKPVYQLLSPDGNPDPHIRVYASGGVEYAFYKRPEDLIDEGVRHKERGYTAFKFRPGTTWDHDNITLKEYISYLVKLREAVGPDFDLIQEFSMRLKIDEALEICPVLEELKFLWLEEPMNRRAENALEDHIKVNRALTSVLLSGGETMTSRFEFKEWIDRDAYDIVQQDCNTMGISEALHVAQMAHMRNKYCCPHNWHGGLTTMANASLVAAIPNRLVLELNQTYNPLRLEIFKDPLIVKNGYMDLPDKPGFGVELADDLEKKFPFIPGPFYYPNPEMKRG